MGDAWRRGILIRFALFAVAVAIIYFEDRRSGSRIAFQAPIHSIPLGILGDILCAAGVAFAIWARVHLGRNWGMPMTLREGHELVTSGPYALVRHPIYTGFLLAMLGSAFAVDPYWIIIFVLAGIYFICSARTEEKAMVKQFPGEYPAYMKRTKMLIPFVL